MKTALKTGICILALFLGLGGCVSVPSPAPSATSAPTPEPVVTDMLAAPTASPPPAPTVAPTATPAPTPDALSGADDTYTFGWLSDTQHYSSQFPDVFYEMTQFLYRERERLNLRYVIHTGDLVHNYSVESQWLIADGAMNELGDVPYGVLAGNHDVNLEQGDYTYFSRYFGEARFRGQAQYGAFQQGNRCHYDLITAGETDYIFVYLGYPVRTDDAIWAYRAFTAHPDRVGVLAVHDYLDTDLTLTEQGRLIFERVVKTSPNVSLVLCGHRYNSACVPVTVGEGEKQREVYQIIKNYQAAGDEGGLGYIGFLRVHEKAGTLEVLSYSPLIDDYRYFDEIEHQAEKYPFDPNGEWFTLPIPWKQG